MGSYFKGWTNTLPYIPFDTTKGLTRDLFIGQVIKINYNADGLITVRLVGITKDINDDNVKVKAYPANMNMVKYPLPGEFVLLFSGIENKFRGTDPIACYYYLDVISSNQHLSFNSNAYAGQRVPEKIADQIYTFEYDQRFLRKMENTSAYLTDVSNLSESLIPKKTIKPQEGDLILQGRFGSAIRMSSAAVPTNTTQDVMDLLFETTTTDNGTKSQWSKNTTAGSPIIVISCNGRQDTYDYEDVNQSTPSMATMHIASRQAIPVNIATSARLMTHRIQYDREALRQNMGDLSSLLQTTFVAGARRVGGYEGDGAFMGRDGSVPVFEGSEIRKAIVKWAVKFQANGIYENGQDVSFNNAQFQQMITDVGWKSGYAWCQLFSKLCWKQAYLELGATDPAYANIAATTFRNFVGDYKGPINASTRDTEVNMSKFGATFNFVIGSTKIYPGDIGVL